jgi:ectoine hydroxylase
MTMDKSCLQYVLTEEERETFERTGYLILENALSPEQVHSITQVVDQIFEKKINDGHDPQKALFFPNFIPEHECFQNLVDHEKTFPKVWGLLGWNIYLYHAHLGVTPPSGLERNNKTLGWHQDSGRVNRDIETHPRPRLSLKIGFFLSDVSEEGRGNFWVVPGSHLNDNLERPAGGEDQPEGAIPVKVKPGTAVFFDRRLWHSASPNWSDVTRKVLFFGYSYRWLRTKDDMQVQHLWEDSDPVRRQLLGDGVNSNGFYSPTEEDAPLMTWLRENSPDQIEK